MSNRTTVKSNIVTQNVPSVTNAGLTAMLNNELADNVRFREDVAVVQNSVVSAITVDFTGKDRVDLTRTGGNLAITVTGMGDGETKFLLITKTAGQAVTFAGVTDVTPIKINADALSLVLYEIVRKGSSFFAKAWVETVTQSTDSNNGVISIASAAEHNALASTAKACVPGRLPSGTQTQKGLVRMATAVEYLANTAGLAIDAAQVNSSNFIKELARGSEAIGDPGGTGQISRIIVFPVALANANYKIIGEVFEANGRAAYYTITSKTAAQFVVLINALDLNIVQNITFNWSAIAI